MFRQFIETFRKPSAKQLAIRELEETQRLLLLSLSLLEYHQAVVNCLQTRLRRLQDHTAEVKPRTSGREVFKT